MSSIDTILAAAPPTTIAAALRSWPERTHRPSPRDWRGEIFYFLLPDRFSNGAERPDRLLDVDLSTEAGRTRIKGLRGAEWKWNAWQDSGANRFQGGTLKGVKSKLDYLHDLGVTTLWVGPIFRQRAEENSYHGYGIQNFLDIDRRFGTPKELVDLVDAAHTKYDMNVVLDVIFNHTGCNFLYDYKAGNSFEPPYLKDGQYDPIWARNGLGSQIYDRNQVLGADDYVWPADLQSSSGYVRAGKGDLGAGDINDDYAEHKRTDFCRLRKLNLFSDDVMRSLIVSYHYWIALADIDGYRIDTFKHVTHEQARTFCNGIKEYAEQLGKDDFFLVAEVAGGNAAQDRYLDVTGRNLNACLDIGEQREWLCSVSKGLQPGADFFAGFNYYDGMGSHRLYGNHHLNIANDHDHVFGTKLRLSVDASNDHQGAVAAALQVFSLGIPCLYYGLEQGLASGAEPRERQYLASWGSSDCLLREAMFGPEHPRASGQPGTQNLMDLDKPGFGPHGTAGWHVFNPAHPIYKRIAQFAQVRSEFKPLSRGRQYQRQTKLFDHPFGLPGAGEIVAWSRLFDEQELLVVVNPHGVERRGAKVLVDSRVSRDGMMVVLNTDPTAPANRQPGAKVVTAMDGSICYLPLDEWLLGPSEVFILANKEAILEAKGNRFRWP